MGASLDSRDHRHAYVSYVFQKLDAFVVNLAPNAGIGDVAEGRKIDLRDEVPACSGQDYNLVRPVLRDPVKGVDKLRMILCRESEWPVVAVKFGNQDTFGVPSQFEAAISSEVIILKSLHGISSLNFVLGVMEDAALVVSVVKFSAIWGGAPADSNKYLAGGQHAHRRSYEIDPERVPIVRVKC